MRLKRLDIYGFKSFGERVSMAFEDGITGVVGPNGSGKSNISDAVRWVLGEQSAKSLRGARMEDVIFNGTEKRKPLAYCEVSLLLDNADGTLGVSWTEVLVTRRVYRSGESEYYLNKSACRLRDIIDLFRDTGIGKEGYSIIGQGRIDEILSARGEDRRQVFEEAAGIVKFRARKEEAERKMERTADNLTRVQDILQESERQLGPLEDQSEKARQYLALYEELKRLDLALFTQKCDDMKRRASEYERIAGERAKLAEHAQRECDALSTQRDTLEQRQAESDARNSDTRDEVVRLTQQAESIMGTQRVLDERVQAARLETTRLQYELTSSGERTRELIQQREELQTALDAHASESADLQQAQLTAEQALAGETSAIELEARDIDARKTALMDAMNHLSDVKSAQARLGAMQSALGARIDQYKKDKSVLTAQSASLSELDASENAELTKAKSDMAALQTAMDGLERERTANRERRESCQQTEQQLISSRQQAQTQLKVLRELERDYEGYQYAVKQVMLRARKLEADGDEPGVVGVVANLIKVPRELERAADMVLGGSLQHIVVEGEQHAKRMIEYLRENKCGRATFLPLTSVRGRTLTQLERQVLHMPGCRGVLSELVEFDPRYTGVIDSLLGRTVVAEDLDSGIEIMRRGQHMFRLVTLKGDVMHSGGSMTGGSVQSRVTSLLSREREIEEYSVQIERLNTDWADVQREKQQLVAEHERITQAREAQQQQLRYGEAGLARLTQQYQQTQSERRALQSRMDVIQSEIDQLCANLADVESELAGISNAQTSAQSDHQQMQREIAERQQELAERRTSLDGEREHLTADRIQLAERARDDANRRKDLDRLAKELAALNASAVDADQSRARAIQAEAGLKLQLEESARNLETARQTLDAARARLESADSERAQIQSGLREANRQLEARRADLEEFTSKQHRAEIQLEHVQSELTALNERIWNDYEITYALAEEFADAELDTMQTEKRIAQLRTGIRQIGTVNVNALEEYQSAKARYDELSTQRDDLIRAQEDLNSIIRELQSNMKTQFLEQFELLNARFQVAFSALFGGGMATLQLQDEADALNCGIDIAAQPPGKKLQMLSLLSGGERALTATAILFAMLDIKPTPFCILDEVEAALDDANIDNFAQYLRAYSQHTQFIVVTHRKGTMEACDALYGVAMEEKGISRMVSVQLKDAS